MPWDDIVRSLHQRVKSIPRDPECLKYMLRLHLKVAGQDFHQHLKQVHLRPGILVLLLQELFHRKHEAFCGSMAAQQMHLHPDGEDVGGSVSARSGQDLERAVYAKYPETEAHIPLAERKGTIPDGIREEIEDLARKAAESTSKKRRLIHTTKTVMVNGVKTGLRVIPRRILPLECTRPQNA